uniref:Putative ATP-dependent RNA helicase DDX27 n=1 Tax=Lygus hesperus TaxID=30085 RepID=A0A0A9W7Z1_LYGHE
MLKELLVFTTGLTVSLVIGGVHASAQEAALQAAPDILIATPGRLVDFLHNNISRHTSCISGNHHSKNTCSVVDLSGIEMVVFDECDKMMTVTLKDQVVDIICHIPEEMRQVVMFSATMTEEVNNFAD